MTSLIDQRVVDKLSGAPQTGDAPSMGDQVRKFLQRIRLRWLFAGIAAIALIPLLAWNVQITLQENDVNSRLSDAQLAGQVGLPTLDAINGELSEANGSLQDARDSIVEGLPDARLSLELISIGEENGIWVRSTGISTETFESIGEHSFPSKAIQIVTDAPINDTIRYIDSLDAGAIEGLEIVSVNINRQSGDSYRAVINARSYRQIADGDVVEEEDN